MLQSDLLSEVLQINTDENILVLNSASDPFVSVLAKRYTMGDTGTLTLAEDSFAIIQRFRQIATEAASQQLRCVAFHDYILHAQAATMDIAIMNLLYQPSNAWMQYGLQVAAYALKVGGSLYVVGAKDRGIVSMARRLQEQFGNVETLLISKGHRVLRAVKNVITTVPMRPTTEFAVFADNKLDEGTRLLLDNLDVQAADIALDLGCGAGFIGLHIARLAQQGHVTMVDVSLAAVAVATRTVEQSRLTNVQVLPSDGAQAVLSQKFDLAATNPPFHQGGIQTREIAERFIHEASLVLWPGGRFYLVANRFLKYETVLKACFNEVKEVGGDSRYKVLRASKKR